MDGEVAQNDAARSLPVDVDATEGARRVARDVEQLGGAQMLVPGGVAGLHAGHPYDDVDGGPAHVVGHGNGPGHVGEPASNLGHHEVAAREGDLGVGGVDLPGAGRRQLDAVVPLFAEPKPAAGVDSLSPATQDSGASHSIRAELLPELMSGNQANSRAKAAQSTGADDDRATDLAAASAGIHAGGWRCGNRHAGAGATRLDRGGKRDLGIPK